MTEDLRVQNPVQQEIPTPSVEEIARLYEGAMASVAYINNGKSEQMTDADWADAVERNKAHVKIMLDKPFWTVEDLSPLRAVLG